MSAALKPISLWKTTSSTPRVSRRQVGLAGVAPVECHLLRHRPARRVARTADSANCRSPPPRRTPARSCRALDPATALDDVLEQAHHLLFRGHRLAVGVPSGSRLPAKRPATAPRGPRPPPGRRPYRRVAASNCELDSIASSSSVLRSRSAVVVEGEGIGSQRLPAPGQQPRQDAHRVAATGCRSAPGSRCPHLLARLDLVVAVPSTRLIRSQVPTAPMRRTPTASGGGADSISLRRGGVDEHELGRTGCLRIPQRRITSPGPPAPWTTALPRPRLPRSSPRTPGAGPADRYRGQPSPHPVIRIFGVEKTALARPFRTHRQLPLAQPLRHYGALCHPIPCSS